MSEQAIGRTIRIEGQLVDVELRPEAYQRAEAPGGFRVGQPMSYVTIRSAELRLVGFVTAVAQTDGAKPGQSPQRVMTVQLVGSIAGGHFLRGVHEYPALDDEVYPATQADFEDIFGSFDRLSKRGQHTRSFCLGRFSHQRKFEVRVLGSQFFGKHLAILGNSGCGKSCTVAKILHETIKLDEARIVLFDLNGEHAAAFMKDGKLDSNVAYIGENDLVLPYWLLRYDELASLFVDASDPLNVPNQISFLRSALVAMKTPAARELGLMTDLSIDTPVYFSLSQLKTYAENLNDARYIVNSNRLAFADLAQRSLEPARQAELMLTQRCKFHKGEAVGETPHPVFNGRLVGMLDRMELLLSDRRYDFLLRPIEKARGSTYFREALNASLSPAQLSRAMAGVLNVMRGQVQPRHNLTIIDLSGLPFETVDITVAVLSRVLFDFNVWSPPDRRHPLLLVYEEAHNYIPRETAGRFFSRAAVEKIAKEGRKYGVAACIVSQRPGELSETVLSQCNNMVIMRMNNPADQLYVQKVVSDHFAAVVRTLPILMPGEGFVIGDAVLMPMQTIIDLPPRQPRSADVDFFRHWSLGTPQAPAQEVLDHWWRQDRSMIRGASTGGEAKSQQ